MDDKKPRPLSDGHHQPGHKAASRPQKGQETDAAQGPPDTFKALSKSLKRINIRPSPGAKPSSSEIR